MSIKKLFGSPDKSRKYLSDKNQKDAFSDVESERNVEQVAISHDTYTPQVDYSDPANFVKYGSAKLYYEKAISRIQEFYPYDGSEAEYNEYLNKSLGIERYIFNSLYPRTNGYANFSADGWGSLNGSQIDGYGLPNDLEYISFVGGPNTIATSSSGLPELFGNPGSSNKTTANVYEEDIYTSAGLPSGYGSGTRTSNLRTDLNDGVTIEFWLKKEAFDVSKTEKEVIFDIWNNEISSSADYGRITLSLSGAASGTPFRITAQSGTSGVFEQEVGVSPTSGSLSTFSHYAFKLINSGSDLQVHTFVNGALDVVNTFAGSAIDELKSKNMIGRLGSLASSPSGSSAPVSAGKLSGSMDEFRFWKTARTNQNIGRHWFTNVRGGANTDLSNASLGLYYKFNEGVVGDSNVDSVVLDYSGRLGNGGWTGYDTNSRSTSSAIVEAAASATEFKDPIIYASHPEVSSLTTLLVDQGSDYDLNNNAAFSNLAPSWVIEEHENRGNTNLTGLSHIVGSYLDKLFLQVQEVSQVKSMEYLSASSQPPSFAQHFPQSLGLQTPELFVDADVLEQFLNRNNDKVFEGDIQNIKNLIYINLYNNLAGTFKAKGTEKAIRNVLRCFYLDDSLVRLKVTADSRVYNIEDNLRQSIANKASLNFNDALQLDSVVYQSADPSNSESLGYISGSGVSGPGYEDKYGLTLEADVTLPYFTRSNDKFDRTLVTASLFGMHTADPTAPADTTWLATDYANFQVEAVRDSPYSKNVYFRLSSSNSPYPIPELTSSVFFDAYDNDRWNISVRVKPSNFGLTDMVTGSSDYNYDIVFQGYNTLSGEVNEQFTVTASIGKTTGQEFLRSPKRVYAGARRTNTTGSVINRTDALISNVKYWTKYISDSDLQQHLYDIDNAGISAANQRISPIDPNNDGSNITNLNTLALNWTFDDVTGSNPSGEFYVTDMSSGSAETRNSYGWAGGISGYQNTGKAIGFRESATQVVVKEPVSSYKFIDPENVNSSNMITLGETSAVVRDSDPSPPKYYYAFEKSMYASISEEMLKFFAGAVDFNNVIGAPVNRYRDRYKGLEKLREIFFRKVDGVSDVEKFIDYYKWFDDALSIVVAQLTPATSEFDPDMNNVVESHVLERNKYQTKFPTLEFITPEPEFPILGINEKLLNWRLNSSPSSEQQNEHSPWWRERAERAGSATISSGDSAVDQNRDAIRESSNNLNNTPSTTLTTVGGTTYEGSTFVHRKLARPYKLDVKESTALAGGTNFPEEKSFEFTYNALAPAGPVNTEGGGYVPQNVLFSFVADFVPLADSVDPADPRKKVRRIIKVNHGRDWEEGRGYSNAKSSYAYPFNIISSSVTTGYNAAVVSGLTSGVEITNLHNDVYGEDGERPMQGPFTNYAVGGHQSRHVKLNTGADNWMTRPEAWKMLIGTLDPSGALAMVGADYPWPEANAVGEVPYPMTASQKAVFYRDFTAKRPVNIKNIHHTTGSTILGNYNRNYEVVQTHGAYSNPRQFIDNQPTLPAELFQNNTTGATQARAFGDTRRTEQSHTALSEYSTGYLTGATNKTVFSSRFSAPGGIDTLGQGYRDFRASEFSVYNALNYRNLSVKKHSQGPSGSISEPTGAGTPGIRVYDIHGKDFGLRSHLARHSARFGRDSLLVTNPGTTATEYPSFHKVNRNPLKTSVYGICGSTTTLPGMTNLSGVIWPASADGANHGNVLLIENLTKRSERLFDAEYAIASGSTVAYSWQSWIKVPDDSSVRALFEIGQETGGGSTKIHQMRRGTSGEIAYELATTDGAGSDAITEWITDTDLLTGSLAWKHFVFTFTATHGTVSSSVDVDFYIDGVNYSSTPTGDSALNWFESGSAAKSNFRQHSGFNVTSPITFFGPINEFNAYEYSGSADEVGMWNVKLNDSEVLALYNGGIPCDLTGSDSPQVGNLMSWWRLGEGADALGSGAASVTASSAGNIINDIVGGAHLLPTSRRTYDLNLDFTTDVLAGCTGSEIGSVYDCVIARDVFDNFNVQHPIPRSDRQYSWFTSSLASGSDDLRYYGYSLGRGLNDGNYKTGSSYVPFFNFVTASDRFPAEFIEQPTTRLNTLTKDPVSSSANSIGYDPAIGNSSYINPALTNPVLLEDDYLNLLLTRRQSTYGWNWTATRQQDHPILMREKEDNIISVVNGDTFTRHALRPVSTRGKPVKVNIAPQLPRQDGLAMTLKISHNNEKIGFNTSVMDNQANILLDKTSTSYDQIIGVVGANTSYGLNWVSYSENLFPSLRNEYASGTVERTGFDNLYWRDTQSDRYTLGSTFSNSLAAEVSQSAWPLDAPTDFLTRTGPIVVTSPAADQDLASSASAGELQSETFSFVTSSATVTAPQRAANLFRSALYSRKHMMSSPYSVVSPNGVVVPETGSLSPFTDNGFEAASQIDIYAGEAMWEANTQAGIVVNLDSTSQFISHPSNPWFTDYDAYKHDLKLISKDSGIIPEFRISEHIEDYINYGILSSTGSESMLEIVGTDINSSQDDFYIDYSNSEFMSGFLGIKEDVSNLLKAKEIKLTCKATTRFNPYKGFYPAQRTLDLVSQFSRSYASSVGCAFAGNPSRNLFASADGHEGGWSKPLAEKLFAPGILYNTIKSGIAVDYPMISDITKKYDSYYSASSDTDNWAIDGTNFGNDYWDYRIPFETMLSPEKHLQGKQFFCEEPHPSASVPTTASWNGSDNDSIYSKMAENFFGSVGDFFLSEGTYTKIKSGIISTAMTFESGAVYGARVKMRKSNTGIRSYDYESGSAGDNTGYSFLGATQFLSSSVATTASFGTSGSYPLPQDPRQNPDFKESFTMYSRPSSFGPPCSGRGAFDAAHDDLTIAASPVDSFNGFNWSFTPPYYNGEAWADLIFRPDHTRTYTLEQIISQIETSFRRVDPGPPAGGIPLSGTLGTSVTTGSTLIRDGYAGSISRELIYAGNNVNGNAMQISASVNLFGVEDVFKTTFDEQGNPQTNTNESIGKRWVIQPKFETPMLNFNDGGIHPISEADGTLSNPQNFGSASVPRGMWHQFGVIPQEASKGIFLEVSDIPSEWLQYHYDVTDNNSMYNDNDAATNGALVYKNMKSLTAIMGFDKTPNTDPLRSLSSAPTVNSSNGASVRLGEIAESRTIKEAVVAVPYVVPSIPDGDRLAASSDSETHKKFFSIPPERWAAAQMSPSSVMGSSLDAAGASIRKLAQKMGRYVLPPQFDFLNVSSVEPVVMYMFEFEYKLDRDDLSYIWQNLAPRNYQKIEKQEQSIAHELMDMELLNEDSLFDSEQIRWMVFKVKQKANANYYDKVATQANESVGSELTPVLQAASDGSATGYDLSFNWPYDYLSIVELIKMDAEVLFSKDDEDDT